jgi:hypothetical protein
VLHRLQRLASARALTSQRWFTIWVTMWLIRRFRKMTGREEKVVYREVLEPGQTLVIAHERQPVDL